MIFNIILLILIVFLIDYILIERRKAMVCNILGPKRYPLIGSFLQFLRAKNVEEVMQLNRDFLKKYKKTYQIWIGSQLTITTSDIKYIESILSNNRHTTKHGMYNLLNDWLGQGLLLSNGTKWFSRRKIITPTFHFKILEQFIPIFDRQSTVLIDKLMYYQNYEQGLDILLPITSLTLDIMAESAMGIKLNAQNYPDCEYSKAIRELSQIFVDRFINVFYRNKMIFSLFQPSLRKRQDKAIKFIHNYTQNIIIERRKLLETKNFNDWINITEDDKEIGLKEKSAFLDVLLRSTIDGKPLTNQDIQEEVDTFLFEGHDTTTSGICFTLYLLSRHKNIQDKVFHEIRQIIGDNQNDTINYKKLTEMKYLECVIKESLRLHPPVPFIGRLIEQDSIMNGTFIPKGTNMAICIDEAMRDPELFDNPNEFIPERHILIDEQENKNYSLFAFIPFSAGPRNCIGQKFAMLEMKSVISKILRHFELLPKRPDIAPINSVTLKSKTGFHMKLNPRIYD